MKRAQVQQKLDKARKLLLARDFVQALAGYERLAHTCPANEIVWFEYGNAAAGTRNRELAKWAWHKAMELAPRNAELILQIGHQHQALRDADGAHSCFDRAASAAPRAINPRISLAVLCEQNHLLEQARVAVEECLAIDPHDEQALYFSAVLDRREQKLERAESRLRNLIASSPRHPFVRYASRYQLAQLLDLSDRFDEAMSLLAEAKLMVRGLADTGLLLRGYDQEAEGVRHSPQTLPKTIPHRWAEAFQKQERDAIPPLAFLGGHPRSGTTLLEQVLDAHPGVAALDEATAFQDVLQPDFCRVKEISNSRINTLRRLYIQALLEDVGAAGKGKLLVDKNPSPTARLPLWLRVFPELRVLIALRDPRDVILSCYFQNIPLNAVNVNFLSFERLAKHYSDLTDIWLAVREWDGFTWVETRYEDTVQDMEKEGRRVTEFL